jgi:DNA integrity scanning protein DisA with diadenylate cyclase activity
MEAGYDSMDKILDLRNTDGSEVMKVKGIGAAKAKLLIDGLKRNNKIISR